MCTAPAISSAKLNSLFLKVRARDGAILIMHDRVYTPAALALALPSLAARFDVLTLSEMEARRGGVAVAGVPPPPSMWARLFPSAARYEPLEH